MGSIERNGSTPSVVSDMGPSFVLPPGGGLVAFAPGGVKNKVDSAPLNNIVPFQRVPVGKGEWAVPAGEQPGGVWMVSPGAKLYLPPNATLTRRPEFRQAVRSFFEAAFQQNPKAVVGGITLRDFRDYVALAARADAGGPDDWRKVEAFERRLVQALEAQPAPVRQPVARPAAETRISPPASRTSPPASKPIVPPIPTVVPPETTISGPPPVRVETKLPEPPKIAGFGGTDQRTAAQVIARENEASDRQQRVEAAGWKTVADAANRPVPANASLDTMAKRMRAFGSNPALITDPRHIAASNELSRLQGVQERIDSLSRATVNPNGEIFVNGAPADPTKVRRDLAAAKEDLRKSLPALEAKVAELEKTSASRNGTPEPRDYTQTGKTGLYLPNHVVQERQGNSGPVADAGGPGDVPPTKPPTGGGGNGDVPHPDEDPEGWETALNELMNGLRGIFKNRHQKLSDSAWDRVRENLSSYRKLGISNKAELARLGEQEATTLLKKFIVGPVSMNKLATGATVGLGLGGGALAVTSVVWPDVVDKHVLGRKTPEGNGGEINKLGPDVSKGGQIHAGYGQIAYVPSEPPHPNGDLADPKVYTEALDALFKWEETELRKAIETVVGNVEANRILHGLDAALNAADFGGMLVRGRLLPSIGGQLDRLNIQQQVQGQIMAALGPLTSKFYNTAAALKWKRETAVSEVVNSVNADIALMRANIKSDFSGLTFETSSDPVADLERIKKNIGELEAYQKSLLGTSKQVQTALDGLSPYLRGLERRGSEIEGAPTLRDAQENLQTLQRNVQQQLMSANTLYATLANQKQSLDLAVRNLELAGQNTQINAQNALWNEASRLESEASNQRELGKSARDRWNAASDTVARPITGAPGFRLPFSGRGNLLERLDDAVKPFGMTANDVPASVWLQVLDKIEPNWIYAVLEPTSRPLTPAEVAQRKAEILGGAERADPKLVSVVLETMTTNR